MKPVCVKCQRFYRPKRNGTPFLEMAPDGSSRPASGTAEPDKWKPYKLWHADLWHCLGCGHELIVGAGYQPMSEHWKDDFEAVCESFDVKIRVNDC